MIISAKVNFFNDDILLLIKVHIQNITSKPGLTKIFLAVFLQLYDLALSLLTYPLNSDLSEGERFPTSGINGARTIRPVMHSSNFTCNMQ